MNRFLFNCLLFIGLLLIYKYLFMSADGKKEDILETGEKIDGELQVKLGDKFFPFQDLLNLMLLFTLLITIRKLMPTSSPMLNQNKTKRGFKRV